MDSPSVGWCVRLAACALALASCDGGPTGTDRATPAVIQPYSGALQTLVVGALAPEPLVVEVLDGRGRPVGGETVSWVVSTGGGSVAPTSSVTNVDGQARTFLRAGPTLGPNVISATAGALPAATFTLSAISAPAGAMTIIQGNSQSGLIGTTLPLPLVVRVTTATGAPVAGVVVNFSAAQGVVAPTSASTDVNGDAQTQYTLPASAGGQQVVATAPGVGQLSFNVFAVLPAPQSLLKVAGDAQTATVGSVLTTQARVRVLLTDGSPGVGRSVSFVPAQGTAAVNPGTVNTDGDGYAATTWTLGTAAGEQQLLASTSGVPSVQFVATATAGAAAQLSLVSGNAQVTALGSALPLPVVVESRDQFGNVVPGATVTFSATAGHGAFTPASALSGADGRASSSWTLAGAVGAKTGSAALAVGAPIALTAVATPALIGLTHRVVDAEYHAATNRLVTVSASPSMLHILDPETGVGSSVPLSVSPLAVSISPDGGEAVVGHDAFVSRVDLGAARVIQVWPVSSDLIDIVHGGNGHAYVFPRTDQWTSVRTIALATGTVSNTAYASIYAGTVARLHPSGNYLYAANRGLSPSDIQKFDIRAGPAVSMYDSPYHGDYPFNGDIWPLDDGVRLISRGGAAFRASEVRAEDMTYAGSLSGLSIVQWVTQHPTTDRIYALPGTSWIGDPIPTTLRVYSSQFLNFLGSVPLPRFPVPNVGTFVGEGRFVFHTADGQVVYVLVRADGAAGLLNDWAIARYARSELP